MIPEPKISSVVQRLLEKTRKNQARWLVDNEPPDTTAAETTRTAPWTVKRARAFILRLPESLIRVSYHSPPADSDSVRIDFCKPDGQIADTVTIADGETGWANARELFFAASRSATGWDQVIEDIDRALESTGAIGSSDVNR